jgi:hypothetical protein
MITLFHATSDDNQSTPSIMRTFDITCAFLQSHIQETITVLAHPKK